MRLIFKVDEISLLQSKIIMPLKKHTIICLICLCLSFYTSFKIKCYVQGCFRWSVYENKCLPQQENEISLIKSSLTFVKLG